MIRILEHLQRFMCGLHGHEEVLHFERHRLSLRCLSCGHQTVGWNLGPDVSHQASRVDLVHRYRDTLRLVKKEVQWT